MELVDLEGQLYVCMLHPSSVRGLGDLRVGKGGSRTKEIDGEIVEIVSDFIFLGSKITADGDCSHEIKRCLLLGRKVMTNLDSIFKSRDIT